MSEHKLLINEPPLQVLPSLAKEVGLNQAIILQQLHYWLIRSANSQDGYLWVYNSYDGWKAQFPFWSTDTIRRALRSLEEQGIVISGMFNHSSWDKTKWYRIDYSKLPSSSVQSAIIEDSNLPSSSYQAETTTETTTENIPSSKKPKRKTEITHEFRTKMWVKYGDAIDVSDEIEKAIAHKQYTKYDGKQRYVEDWLKRAVSFNSSAPTDPWKYTAPKDSPFKNY